MQSLEKGSPTERFYSQPRTFSIYGGVGKNAWKTLLWKLPGRGMLSYISYGRITNTSHTVLYTVPYTVEHSFGYCAPCYLWTLSSIAKLSSLRYQWENLAPKFFCWRTLLWNERKEFRYWGLREEKFLRVYSRWRKGELEEVALRGKKGKDLKKTHINRIASIYKGLQFAIIDNYRLILSFLFNCNSHLNII